MSAIIVGCSTEKAEIFITIIQLMFHDRQEAFLIYVSVTMKFSYHQSR